MAFKQTLVNTLGAYKKKVLDAVPLFPAAFYGSKAVAQVFVNLPDRTTSYGISNFASLYSPKTGVPCTYEICLYDPSGQLVLKRDVKLPLHGSLSLRLQDLTTQSLPEFGMVTARIRPQSTFPYVYAHMGSLRAHFYTLFQGKDLSSVAMVHPQTLFNVPACPDLTATSLLLIPIQKLAAVEIYQINPSAAAVPSTLSLMHEGKRLVSEAATIPARGSRRVSWPSKNLMSYEYVTLETQGMTADNAKPLIFNQFEDGSFTASHS